MDTIESTIQQHLELQDTRPTIDNLKARLERARELHLTARDEVQSVCEALFERGATYAEREDVAALLGRMDLARVGDFELAVEAVRGLRAREGR
jgi:methylthioribose-1-phosphate isomerase